MMNPDVYMAERVLAGRDDLIYMLGQLDHSGYRGRIRLKLYHDKMLICTQQNDEIFAMINVAHSDLAHATRFYMAKYALFDINGIVICIKKGIVTIKGLRLIQGLYVPTEGLLLVKTRGYDVRI